MEKKFNHLSLSQRKTIEKELNAKSSILSISKLIGVSHTTVLREINRNKYKELPNLFNAGAFMPPCRFKIECKKNISCSYRQECYLPEECIKLKKSPYVCNACGTKSGCRKEKMYYKAKIADMSYEDRLVVSRSGFDLSIEQVELINDRITPLVTEKKQSLYHIYTNNRDILDFSLKSFYTYISANVFDFKDMDLRRKVTYKARKNSKKRKTVVQRKAIQDRTHDLFLIHIGKNPNLNIVEIDCVEGKKSDNKVMLTMLWRNRNFMLIYLLDKQTSEQVDKAFNHLQTILGIEEYSKLFQVVLLDRGSEFMNPKSMEVFHETQETTTKVFYCDPHASWQKGSLEKNHEFIRYYIPKYTSLEFLTQEKCTLMANHINNTKRGFLNDNSPYQAMSLTCSADVLAKLDMIYIAPNNVNLNKSLIK